MSLIPIEEAQAQLPRIGDIRKEILTTKTGSGSQDFTPQRCVVVYVHPEHLWYTVQFKNGFKESYKVPILGGKYNG